MTGRRAEEQYVRVWYDELGAPKEGEGGQSGEGLGRCAPCSSQHSRHAAATTSREGNQMWFALRELAIKYGWHAQLRTGHELLGGQQKGVLKVRSWLLPLGQLSACP